MYEGPPVSKLYLYQRLLQYLCPEDLKSAICATAKKKKKGCKSEYDYVLITPQPREIKDQIVQSTVVVPHRGRIPHTCLEWKSSFLVIR